MVAQLILWDLAFTELHQKSWIGTAYKYGSKLQYYVLHSQMDVTLRGVLSIFP